MYFFFNFADTVASTIEKGACFPPEFDGAYISSAGFLFESCSPCLASSSHYYPYSQREGTRKPVISVLFAILAACLLIHE